MNFLAEYGLFFAQTLTLVLAILIVAAGLLAIFTKGKSRQKLKIEKLNKHYQEMADFLNEEILDKKARKKAAKKAKLAKKEHKHERNVFVLNFHGDIKASAVETLRKEVTALLLVASTNDEIIVKLESGGGMVHSYGLAASQLQRIKEKRIPLTICVDKIAASGGYLMACVADKILAAPFAIIGSIGVVAQLPNFNRLMKRSHIDYEMITAGQYKRTLTLLGKNTKEGREKFQEDVDEIHTHFKNYITEHRQLDIDTIATGEHWLAKKALELRLVDHLSTSDDYLLQRSQKANLYEVSYQRKSSVLDKLTSAVQAAIEKGIDFCLQRDREGRFY
ncbi:MAG: protease SohB [Gammaproteobacteria bacterium]